MLMKKCLISTCHKDLKEKSFRDDIKRLLQLKQKKSVPIGEHRLEH